MSTGSGKSGGSFGNGSSKFVSARGPSLDRGSLDSADAVLVQMLQSEHKRVVQHTWQLAISEKKSKSVTPVAELVESFYNKLFIMMPETKLMFNNNTFHQTRAMSGALSRMMQYLDNGEQLRDQMQELAATHVHIGVTAEMFDAFGKALIAAIAERIGADWTPAMQTAWENAYTLVSKLLQSLMEDIQFKSAGMPKWLRKALKDDKPKLRRDWEIATEDRDRFLSAFYARYFKTCPEAKDVFQGRMDLQGKAVYGALQQVIALVDRPDKLEAQLRAVAKSHARMGVTAEMFHEFSNTMVITLGDLGAERFDDESRMRWKRAMHLLTMAMVGLVEYENNKKGGECSIS